MNRHLTEINMSETKEELKGYVQEWKEADKLAEEAKERKADIRKSLKNRGYNTKAFEILIKDMEEGYWDELSSDVEIYRDAFYVKGE